MKTQMRFQKILMLVTLIISAITLVYAFSFSTGTVSTLYYMTDKDTGWSSANAAICEEVYEYAWTVNNILVYLAVAFVVIIAINYICANQKRRNYYITNYISIIVTIVYMLVVAIVGIALVSSVISEVNTTITTELWNTFEEVCNTWSYKYFRHNDTALYLGYAMYAIVIVNAVLLALNLLWKVQLMKGEKQLLAQSAAKEVA